MDSNLNKFGKAYQQINEGVTVTKIFLTALEQILYRIDADEVSRSGKAFIIRKGYFYHPAADLKTWANNIMTKLPAILGGAECVEIDRGDEFKKFVGGAPLKKQSHYWIKLEIKDYE